MRPAPDVTFDFLLQSLDPLRKHVLTPFSETCAQKIAISASNTNKVGLRSSGVAVDRVGSGLDDGPFYSLG